MIWINAILKLKWQILALFLYVFSFGLLVSAQTEDNFNPRSSWREEGKATPGATACPLPTAC